MVRQTIDGRIEEDYENITITPRGIAVLQLWNDGKIKTIEEAIDIYCLEQTEDSVCLLLKDHTNNCILNKV